MCVQYSGLLSTVGVSVPRGGGGGGGYLEYRGECSVQYRDKWGDVMSTMGDIMINVGDIMMIHVGNIMNTVSTVEVLK